MTAQDREKAAMRTFRRAMCRLEKRARRLGLHSAADVIRMRSVDPIGDFAAWAECDRANARHAYPELRRKLRRGAFFFECVAAAVAKLRSVVPRRYQLLHVGDEAFAAMDAASNAASPKEDESDDWRFVDEDP